MKTTAILIILATLISCKVKTLNTTKEIQHAQENNIKDSIVKTSTELENKTLSQTEITNSHNFTSLDWGIEYVPEVDSSGTIQPFTYLEKIGKDTLHYIHITGNAKLTKGATIKQVKNKLTNFDKSEIDKSESSKSETHTEAKTESKRKSVSKDKKVKVVGMQFGMYAIILAIAVLCIILFWFFGMPKKNKSE